MIAFAQMHNRSRVPERIQHCPIHEAVFEVRYSSAYPTDAVFGIVYSAIKPLFPDVKPETLPIAQLPEVVRETDQNLRYQAYHRLQIGNMAISIGPRVLVFTNISPYAGWEKWKAFFDKALSLIGDQNVLLNVERIGLRYVNLFDYHIFDKIDLDVSIRGIELKEEPTTLRVEMLESGITKVLQVSNYVKFNVGGIEKQGSIIDIDCIQQIDETDKGFVESYHAMIERSHDSAKELFFGLLKESFVNELNPVFGE